jgi:uncharacterized protein YggE
MKKLFAVLLALSLCLFTAAALAEGDDNTVSAIGAASVNIQPDTATFTAGVNTQADKVADAQAANAKAMQAVLEALKKQGVADADMQTQSFSVSPSYNYSTSNPTPTGYTVNNTVIITVRDLSQLSKLLDTAIAAGANDTYGVTFTSSQYDAAYDQALQAAVQSALHKADVMAKALNREVGAVQTVTETGDTYLMAASSKSSTMSAGDATPIQNGVLGVTANVTVVAELK